VKFNLLTFGDHLEDPVTKTRVSVADRHQGIMDTGVAAETAGFDGVNLGEHHAGEFVTVSPPVTLAAVAARTSTLRLGTAVTLIANNDPVRIAEDYAILDLVSHGRTELVVGRGNLFPATYRLFGQDLEDSRTLFEQHIELVLKLWTEKNVSWSGLGRAPLEDVTLQPFPAQKPHPPMWIGGGGSAETAELAARLGLPIMLPSSFSDPNKFVPVVQEYQERFARYHGSADSARVGAPWHVHIERNSQDAKRNWRPRYMAYHDWFGTQVGKHNPTYTPAPLDYDWATTNGPAIAASPAEAVDRLKIACELLEVDTSLLYLDMGGAPVNETLEQIDLICAELLPQLR
jgi:alkanesulfonate monooxygenase SsuD/methylene tetrahydromethanopterin reductase-like flavin-dependent oxidoreductase (luciferase family)